MTTTWHREIPLVLGDIKIAHSLFALPFALASLWVAAKGWPGWPLLGWVILAMVCARTYAMAFNRWCDRKIDSQKVSYWKDKERNIYNRENYLKQF